jgi:outer membrane receptor protein involved in Fe transport
LLPDGYTAVKYSIGQSDCTADRVQLGDVGAYVDNNTRWTSWLRTDVGAREEVYSGRDLSLLPGTPHSLTPYTQSLTLFQPKGDVVLGPWWGTELYVSAGRGFHSDDIRGVSGTVPVLGISPLAGPTPLLVKADGEEVGLRTDVIPLTRVQIAFFNLHLASEQVYDQDEGEDQAGPPSTRDGIEFSAEYRPARWLELNTDLSFAHARFTDVTPATLSNDYGDNGFYIPNAPGFIGSFGAIIDNLGPWYGGVQVRILGAIPLTPDNLERDAGYTETNINLGYRVSKSLKAQVEIFNAFDVKANAGAYYYTTRLANEPAIGACVPNQPCPFTGVADHQVHPLEPISARFSMTATF